MAAKLELASYCVLFLPAAYGKSTTDLMDTLQAYTAPHTAPRKHQHRNPPTLPTGARAPADMLSSGSGACHY